MLRIVMTIRGIFTGHSRHVNIMLTFQKSLACREYPVYIRGTFTAAHIRRTFTARLYSQDIHGMLTFQKISRHVHSIFTAGYVFSRHVHGMLTSWLIHGIFTGKYLSDSILFLLYIYFLFLSIITLN